MERRDSLDEDRLRRLALRLLDIQEAERRRIAADLHDDVGQLLTALKLTLSMVDPGKGNSGTGEAVREARELTATLIERVRDLTLDLRPSMLDDLGLKETLEWYLERAARHAGLRLELDLRGLDEPFHPRVENACFRVIQEAVSNVSNHAGAQSLAIGVRRSGATLDLEIRDDGRGFEVDAGMRRSREGYTAGLAGMEERLELLGGVLGIESGGGHGTRISASLPLDIGLATGGMDE